MRFRTLCLAGACVPALAAAQSGVTLFGVVDMGVSHYSTQGGASVTKLISGGLQASRIGQASAPIYNCMGGGFQIVADS